MLAGSYRLTGPATLSCDVLVIGSGAGGATVGERLARAGYDVLMVEEGPVLPAAQRSARVTEELPRMWRGGGLLMTQGRPGLAYAEGRCAGGGTEINSGIMQRVPDALVADWARTFHIAEFSPEQLTEYYDRVAAEVSAQPHPGPLGPPSQRLRAGAEALGWAYKGLERAYVPCRCGAGPEARCQGCGRQSMTATLLPRALQNGLRLVGETRIERLQLRHGRFTEARGTAVDGQGRRYRVAIQFNSVFLCAGAVHSAALLQRSGLGGNIGRSLQFHPTVKAIARFQETLDAAHAPMPLYAITEFMPDQRLGGSVFQPGFLGMALAEDWPQRSWLADQMDRVGLYYAMVRASATGQVRTLPAVREPVIRYAPNVGDQRNLAQGLGRLGEALLAAGASHVYPGQRGHPGWTRADQPRAFAAGDFDARHSSLMSIHMFASCPPGERSDWCATDSFGRVSGVANAVLADASQIPTAPGVNPQLTVMAMALRNAEAFLAGAMGRKTAHGASEAA